MPTFGDYAPDMSNDDLDGGEYTALITKVEIPKDDKGEPLRSYDKNVVDVSFAIDGDVNEIKKRRYSISFGQNTSTGAWSAFSELLAAACGVPCGASNQRKLGVGDLQGQWVRVVLKKQEKSGRMYLNVTDVLPPKRQKPQPAADKPDFTFRPDPAPPSEIEDIEDEIPFS